MHYQVAQPRINASNAIDSIVIVHPTGNEFSRNAALAFHECGILNEFWTAIAWNSNSRIAPFIPKSMRVQLERRAFSGQYNARLKTHPWREMGRLLSAKLKLTRLTTHERGIFSVD